MLELPHALALLDALRTENALPYPGALAWAELAPPHAPVVPPVFLAPDGAMSTAR